MRKFLEGGAGWRKQVPALIARDGLTCWLCGDPIPLMVWSRAARSLSVDHVEPRSLGGGDELENLRLAHLFCNISRGATPESELPEGGVELQHEASAGTRLRGASTHIQGQHR